MKASELFPDETDRQTVKDLMENFSWEWMRVRDTATGEKIFEVYS
jgi:hypothetical protein